MARATVQAGRALAASLPTGPAAMTPPCVTRRFSQVDVFTPRPLAGRPPAAPLGASGWRSGLHVVPVVTGEARL